MSDTIELGQKATQTTFARLVGVSQPAIAKQLEKGVLPRGGTFGDWLRTYTEHLRNEAAGRGGDHQATLTLARIEESKENSAEKRQRRLMAARTLVIRDEIESLVLELPAFIQSSVMNAGDQIIEALESRYSIELDDDVVTKPLRAALGHTADRVRESARALRGDSGSFGSAASDTDSAMG